MDFSVQNNVLLRKVVQEVQERLNVRKDTSAVIQQQINSENELNDTATIVILGIIIMYGTPVVLEIVDVVVQKEVVFVDSKVTDV